MNEVILTLILLSPTGLTTTTYTYDEQATTCEEAGEEMVGEWISTPPQRYIVSGYHCQTNEAVTGTIYPNEYSQ